MRNSDDNPQLMQPSLPTNRGNMLSSEASYNLQGGAVRGLFNACNNARTPHSLPINSISLIELEICSISGDEVKTQPHRPHATNPS